MKKLINVVMLPTEKAKIHKHNVNNLIIMSDEITGKSDLYNTTPQHLYFTSDDEIKEGDWCLIDNNVGISTGYQVLKCEKADNKNGWYHFGNMKTGRCKKIIAATDEFLNQELRFNGIEEENLLPRPSNEFLEKFCELGGIWEVAVKYKSYLFNPYTEKEVTQFDTIYAEDLESRDKLHISPDNTITIYPIKK